MDEQGWSALAWAVARGKGASVKALLSHPPAHAWVGPVRTVSLWHLVLQSPVSALAQRAVLQHLARVPICAEALDAPNAQGYTPLMLAAQRGHSPLVRALVQWGANVHARDPRGLTAFDQALLVSIRAPLSTPAARAKRWDDIRALMGWLLEQGVDPRPQLPSQPHAWQALERRHQDGTLNADWQPLYHQTRLAVRRCQAHETDERLPAPRRPRW